MVSGCGSRLEAQSTEEKVVINVIAGQTTADAGVTDILEDYVEDAFPNVTLEWQTVTWGQEFDALLRANFAAGETPDMILGKDQDVWAYYKIGHLKAMDEKLTDLAEPDSMKQVTIEGEVYGIPLQYDYQGVLYNETIFEQLGVSVPTTEQELAQIVSKCEQNGVTPFAFAGMDQEKMCSDTQQFLLNEIFYEDPLWGDKFRNGEVFTDQSPEFQTCMEKGDYMLKHSWSDAMAIENYDCRSRFADGEAAMYMANTWELSQILQYSGNTKFGIFPYPNQNGDARLIQDSSITLMKSSTSPYQEQVDAIIRGILNNPMLQEKISQYTQTKCCLDKDKAIYPETMEDAIASYQEKNQIMDSLCLGNQFSWNYLMEVTQKQRSWMAGDCTLEKLLQYAELKRPDSD